MGKKHYDVTIEISEDSVVYPGDPLVRIGEYRSIRHGDVCNISKLTLGSHTGTHVDAPKHFYEDGMTVNNLPLDNLIGKVKVFHIFDKNSSDTRLFIGVEDLKNLQIDEGDRIIFKTHNSDLLNMKEFYPEFVYLHPEAARYLVKKKIKTLGFDYFSVEKYDCDISETHYILLKENVIVIEGLDLRQIMPGDYEMVALPLKIRGCDGSPIRVVLSKEEE